MPPHARPEETSAVSGEPPACGLDIRRHDSIMPAEAVGGMLGLDNAAHRSGGPTPHPSGNPGSLRRPAFTNGVATRGSQ